MLAPDTELRVEALPASDQDVSAAVAPQSLLRFLTCGSVDDGKSTLIGRLLYECGAVFDDQMAVLEDDSRRYGTDGGNLDFSLLVDGLSAEREQGITIDVAYRYFSTRRRAFIVADTPGHEQYTRNMATGASNADLAVLLVDARKGLLEQTRRHAYIASLLRIPHVVLAVNKMDLAGFDRPMFDAIERDFRQAAEGLGFQTITAIPMSARAGDNVVKPSAAMPWYTGATLLDHLESIEILTSGQAGQAFVMPVQWVNRPDAGFRGFSGTIAKGAIAPGDRIHVYPGGQTSCVSRIVTADGDMVDAAAGQAVTLVLDSEIDVSRGDVIAAPLQAEPQATDLNAASRARVKMLWTGAMPGRENKTYIMQLAGVQTPVRLARIHYRLDIAAYARIPAEKIAMNEAALVELEFGKPVAIADYTDVRALGGLMLIDRYSNETLAFGMVEHQAETSLSAPPAGTAAPAAARFASLHRRFERIAGVAGTTQRSKFLYRLSWRALSAVLVGVIAGGVSGSFAIALAAGLADAVVRPLMHRWHRAFWRRDGEGLDLNLDGDGI